MLPRLASPMLQTVPEHANNCMLDPNIDIFDGFGNAGMGVASSLPVHFDKRIEDVASNSQTHDNTPFTSPAIIQSPMEYPGLTQYNSFPGLDGAMNRHGHGQPMPTMLRQDSNSNGFAVQDYHLKQESGLEDYGLGLGRMDMAYR